MVQRKISIPLTVDPRFERRVLSVSREPDGRYLLVKLSLSQWEEENGYGRFFREKGKQGFWIVGFNPGHNEINLFDSNVSPSDFLYAWNKYKDLKFIKVYGEFRLVKV